MANRIPRPSAPAPQGGRFTKSFCALAGAVAIGGLVGCAPPGEEIEAVEQPAVSFNGVSFNGVSFNGVSFNGVSFNGLSSNGVSFNGASFNGTPNPAFASWFNLSDGGDIAMHDMTMKYLVRCAIKQGRVASFTDKNGVVHTWEGGLGLADSWDQSPPTDDQKKWVSACLLAHINSALPTPKSIQISLRGAASSLTETNIEKGAIGTFDGVFFGDVFGSTQKRYICRPTWTPPINYQETLMADWGRQCFFSPDGCGGFFTQVDCNTACTAAPAGSNYQFGPTCSVGGVTYNAINAYVPRFKKAREWAIGGGATLANCTGCLDGKVLDNLTSTATAQVGGWTSNGAGGLVYLDVRYQNSTGAAQNLRVQMNGAFVMSGSANQNWSFAPTGSGWAVRSIPVNLAAGGIVKLMGPTSGKGPKVEVVSLRAQ
jgi:hypothetical protein